MKGRPPVCLCSTCPKCKRREIKRRHYEKHGERVRQEQRERVAAKKAAGLPRMTPEQKAQANYRAAMRKGKAPPHGRFVLHDGHLQAWGEAVRLIERLGQQKHDAHVRAWGQARQGDAWRHKYRTDPEFNAREKVRARMRKLKTLDGRIASNIAEGVKAGKFRGGWVEVLGYTPRQLATHLRRTVPKGYTWEQFLTGELHIDHITPRSAFDLSDVQSVRACWCLSNLRLLPATENIRKGRAVEYLL